MSMSISAGGIDDRVVTLDLTRLGETSLPVRLPSRPGRHSTVTGVIASSDLTRVLYGGASEQDVRDTSSARQRHAGKP